VYLDIDMSLQEVLTIKLQRDLLKLSQDYAAQLGVELDSDFINETIQKHTQSVSFDFNDSECTHPLEERCCARRWWNSRDIACTHRKTRGDYCGKHNQMITEYGTLRFDDIRNPKPKYDLIKLKTGNPPPLKWKQPPKDQLQSVLNQQQHKVILAAPKLIVQ
jgi:hypothetical protein